MSLRGLENGLALTLSACLMIVATDIGSWAVGRRYGRRPLSRYPRQNHRRRHRWIPLGDGGGTDLRPDDRWPLQGLPGLLLGALIALFALVGDGIDDETRCGVKDSGDMLPGHGGILDRIDSYLFTPAVIYYAIALCQPLLTR